MLSDLNFDQIGFFVFVFILGIVFFALIASVCYLCKKSKMCAHSREARQNKNILASVLAVEDGETIIIKPEDLLTFKQPVMASLFSIPGGSHNHPAVTCGSSRNAIVITMREEHPPPSYEMATECIGHRY